MPNAPDLIRAQRVQGQVSFRLLKKKHVIYRQTKEEEELTKKIISNKGKLETIVQNIGSPSPALLPMLNIFYPQ